MAGVLLLVQIEWFLSTGVGAGLARPAGFLALPWGLGRGKPLPYNGLPTARLTAATRFTTSR